MACDGHCIRARAGFTLLEVLIASIILGLGLAGILASMSNSQKLMQSMPDIMTAQEVMDLGDMAYPLDEVQDEEDIDVQEQSVDDLWRVVAGDHGPRLTSEQRDKYHGFRWERERVEKNPSEDDLKRRKYLHLVRVTVRWGDRFAGERNEESYVTLWRDPNK